MAPVATEFEKIIHAARERKKNEALADRIFSKGRRQSAPWRMKSALGASLASRIGVKRPPPPQRSAAVSQHRRASVPVGNVDGEWTHDLHGTVNRNPGGGSLSSRITLPATNSSAAATKKKKAAKLSAALGRMDTDESVQQQVNIIAPRPLQTRDAGMAIRGLAGPFAVMGQNFALGTTAADVESAMTPVGGDMLSCKLVKTQPFIIVEMVFASREGGERVIEMFDNKTADGRIIKVYPKPGGYQPERNAAASSSAPSSREQFVDGTMGFSNDLIDTDNLRTSSSNNYNNNNNNNNNRLHYVDRDGAANRRGRGFQRGRGAGR